VPRQDYPNSTTPTPTIVAPTSRVPGPDVLLLIALYIFEVSALLVLVVTHKKPIGALLVRPAGVTGLPLLIAGPLLLGAAGVIVYRWATRARRDARRFGLTVALNLVPVLVLLGACEIAVRLLAVRTPRGPVFMERTLLPWTWADVLAHNGALLERTSLKGSYLVADETLGWVIRPDRRSADDRYFSSVEGLRSSRPGEVFAARAPRRRVAIVGDSFTFGLEVGFEDTWGYRLERALGPDAQVLNFGVDGFGVDQAYLRYRRDVRAWRPDVVIFGLITHDLYRSMATYTFLSFPGWPFPFAKPRFVVRDDGLSLLNVPLPAPQTILAASSITELPFIEYDPGYVAEDWEWNVLDRSWLFRYFVSSYRHAMGRDERSSEKQVVRLNQEIVRAFLRDARADGAIPLVLYFPSRVDFRQLGRDAGWTSLGQRMLRGGDIPHVDLTSCVAALAPAARFGPQHYSPGGNAAVAGCLTDRVRGLLSERQSPSGH